MPLSYMEGGTAAVYHSAETSLRLLDVLQFTFLECLGLSPETALSEYNLAPLGLQRDIAMLVLLCKVTWDKLWVHGSSHSRGSCIDLSLD